MITTAAPVQADWTDGQLVNAAALNTQLRDPINNWVRTPPQAQVYRNAAGTLVSSTTYSVHTWDIVWIDNNAAWSAANPTRLTIQAPGRYMITARYVWGSYAGGQRVAMLRKNAASNPAAGTIVENDAVNPVGTGSTSFLRMTTYAYLAAGDYLEMFVWQNSGTTQAIVVGLGAGPALAFRWIGR